MKVSSIGFGLLVLAMCLGSPADAANILLISDSCAPGEECANNQRDDSLVEFLEDLGHFVDTSGMGAAYHTDTMWWLDGDKIAAFENNDMALISRRTNSGDYNGADAIQIWNGIPQPIILQSAFITRNSRWGWQSGTNIGAPDASQTQMAVENPNHPIVSGLELELSVFDWEGPSIGGSENHTGAATWPKAVTSPALSEMGEDANIIGSFDDRAFLFELEPGYPWVTAENGMGSLGGRRLFMGHWGYDEAAGNTADGTYNFLDFTTPDFLDLVSRSIDYLVPPDVGAVCDFDGNAACDVDDLDALLNNLGSDDPLYDMDLDGTVTLGDRDVWLTTAGQMNIGVEYVTGDTNLNGQVNAGDLNDMGISWQSTDNPGWGNGDFDGNDIVNATDLNETGLNWLHGTAAAATAVPEPATSLLAMISLLGLLGLRRR